MTVALDTVEKLTVTTLRRGFNQAAVLTAEHALKIDDPAVLTLGEEVTFTDPDLGFVFRGTITEVNELWEGGEGVVYSCADLYRWLMKEPAEIDGTTKIAIEEQNPREAIDSLISSITTPTSCNLQWDSTQVPSTYSLEPINMSGQSVGEWIQRILNQTEDTVCWIDYVWDAGCGQYVSRLKFDLLSNLPDVDLRKGDYTVIDPETDDSPLIVGGSHRYSLDDKYHKVCVEGCGEFERYNLRYIPPVSAPPYDAGVFTFKYWVPEDWATPRYLDADGHCREDWFARIVMGNATYGQASVDQHNLEAKWDETEEKWYWELRIRIFGIWPPGDPPVPEISAYFSYTGYIGPMISCRAASTISESEGRFLLQRPDLYKFTGLSSHDDSSVMQSLTDRLYKRYCEGPDRTTAFQLHMKGVDPDLVLGAHITSPAIGEPSIREMAFDFRARNIAIGCSDAPLRSEVENAEFRARFNRELGGNEYLTERPEDSCMCGGTVYTDPNENRQNPRMGRGRGGSEESWDCNEWWKCIPRDDNLGMYRTQEECEDNCIPAGWQFIPCVGCVPTGEWGAYETEEECETDNPDPYDPIFNCTSGVSGAASAPASRPPYHDIGCIGVSCDEAGDGSFFLGFIKRIRADRRGHLVLAECEDTKFEVISAGFNGQVQWLVSVDVFGPSVVLYYNEGTFSNGLLISMRTITPAGQWWHPWSPSSQAFVATPCSI